MSFLEKIKSQLFENDEEKTSIVNKMQTSIADQFRIVNETDIKEKELFSIPLEELSTLGPGAASLLSQIQTLADTKRLGNGKLYRVANLENGAVLKQAKDGTFWGAMKTKTKASKMARFEEVSPLSSAGAASGLISPTTIMMTAAFYSIEKKMDKIAETSDQIFSFLENEKESQIQADLELLNSTLKELKFNWDKEVFVNGHYKLVLDIKRNAAKDIRTYQKEVAELQKSNSLVETSASVNALIKKVLKKYKFYQMSLFIFAMASYSEILLLGDFREEHILKVREEIESLSATYKEEFALSTSSIEKAAKVTIESNALKGLGTVGKTIGNMIGNIPKLKEGQVDEWFIKSGEFLEDGGKGLEKGLVKKFKDTADPMTNLFVEKIDMLDTIFNKTSAVCCDNEKIYLLTA